MKILLPMNAEIVNLQHFSLYKYDSMNCLKFLIGIIKGSWWSFWYIPIIFGWLGCIDIPALISTLSDIRITGYVPQHVPMAPKLLQPKVWCKKKWIIYFIILALIFTQTLNNLHLNNCKFSQLSKEVHYRNVALLCEKPQWFQ